ncbi:isoprenoid biosynthesis protein ElbB [Candidatus Fermentibacteria bacterium]|nr:MAG: isoprenoid biosynthesis protein ElbB [Candidatus Fermentibacteria bacterium]
MKKAAVLLSGCGNMDGSEIHESVSAVTALDLAGWKIVFIAPDTRQARTVSYLTGKPVEHRNALEEAARIARGDIKALEMSILDDVDAVVVPGGFGAALTLCDFAERGIDCQAHPQVKEFLQLAHKKGKPVAAMCIAPALIARCIPGATVTTGNDSNTAEAIEKMNCSHMECSAEEVIVDRKNRIITTPAYMTATGPGEVFKGAVRMVEELDRMISEGK